MLSAFAFLLAGSAANSRVDAIFGRMTAQGVPGLTYAIVRDGRVVQTNSFGYANLEDRSKAHRETVYEIGSMTKQFTAACVLMLADEGKLKLDDPIGTYLKDIPATWKPLTIRRLLSHTSGLKDYLGSFDPGQTGYVSYDTIFAKVGGYALDFAPGTSWSYSNTGYILASLLVERITGEKLGAFMKKRIFTPLGMTHTRTSDPTEVVLNRAQGYGIGPKDYSNTQPISPSLAGGAGNLLSTVDDLAKWSKALYDGKLLKPESHKEFTNPVPFLNGRSSGYALGWFIHPESGKLIVEHGGNTLGFSSNITNIPAFRESIIVLTNGGGLGPKTQIRQAIGVLHPEFDLSQRKGTDPYPRQSLEMFVTMRKFSKGKYDLGIFDPGMKDMLGTLRGGAVRAAFGQIGKTVKSWEYLEGERSNGDWISRYRFRVGGVTAYVEVLWTPEGKMASFEQIYAE